MGKRFWRMPLLQVAILGLLTLATRLPFRSQVLFNWDSVNFALGVIDFDVVQHRPHPPGYVLYVATARALTWLTKDPNASLVCLSMAAGTLSVLLTYALGRRLFGARDAFFAGLLLLTSPLAWFHDEIALTYSVEGFFSLAIAYACYRTRTGSTGWAYAGALLLGLAGGFRQTTLLFMLPLSLYAARRLPWRHRLGTAVVAIAICLGWGLPLLAETGGLGAYLRASQQLSSIVEPGSSKDLLHSLFYGGHVPLLLVLAHWLGLFPIGGGARPAWMRWFLLLWVAPGLLLIALRHIGQSGYAIFVLPPIFVYTPALLRGALGRLAPVRSVPETRPQGTVEQKVVLTLVILAAVGVVTFVSGGQQFIRLQDRRWRSVQALPDRYPPEQTVILTDLRLDRGFRHFGYYAPDYHVYAFFTPEVRGPLKVDSVPLVAGWVFSSYRGEDNYNLEESQHRLNATLDLPPGTTGLILTDEWLVTALLGADGDDPPPSLTVTQLDGWLTHVALPADARWLVATDGRLEVR
jgi:4-amino-4-deoxy-L-arabinose transferase-like glycosyltransferase